MTLAIIRLLFDAGLVALIWIVQLVIYPSFLYYSRDNLKRWHDKYTNRITYVVLPLMLGQLITAAAQIWMEVNWFTIISVVIVCLLWLSTFLKFVPLHNKITAGSFQNQTLVDLDRLNWGRTVLWTILFMISLGEVLN